jgi:hypothetical protein
LLIGDLEDARRIDVFPIDIRGLYFRELDHDGAINGVISVVVAQREVAKDLDILDPRAFSSRKCRSMLQRRCRNSLL